MEKGSYQKIYYQLLKEHPHNIDAFEKLAKYYKVDFEEIILNKIWNEDEKARLLRAFGHNKEEYELRNKDDRKT